MPKNKVFALLLLALAWFISINQCFAQQQNQNYYPPQQQYNNYQPGYGQQTQGYQGYASQSEQYDPGYSQNYQGQPYYPNQQNNFNQQGNYPQQGYAQQASPEAMLDNQNEAQIQEEPSGSSTLMKAGKVLAGVAAPLAATYLMNRAQSKNPMYSSPYGSPYANPYANPYGGGYYPPAPAYGYPPSPYAAPYGGGYPQGMYPTPVNSGGVGSTLLNAFGSLIAR